MSSSPRAPAPADQGSVAVRLRGIGKRFPGVIANDDVNIDVRRGTIHAIVGENGAGKSTLMKILYGVQPPDSGTIEIGGEQVTLHSPADAITTASEWSSSTSSWPTTSPCWRTSSWARRSCTASAARLELRSSGSPSLDYGLDVDTEPAGRGPRRRRPAAGRDPQGALPRREIIILDEPTAVLVPHEVDELFTNLRRAQGRGPDRSSSSPTSSTRCSRSPTRSP